MQENGVTLADMIPCYEPDSANAYQDIKKNLNVWIENAIENAKCNLTIIKSLKLKRTKIQGCLKSGNLEEKFTKYKY